MLCSYVGVYVDQEEFVDAVGIRKKLDEYGMIVPEMRTAISILTPQLQFWYKPNATLNDISEIVNRFNFPVGVEWQGVFFEDEDEDNGHYSVVTHIDTTNNIVMLSDPYRRFAGNDRRFHVLEFDDRWWDENEVINPYTGTTQVIRDDHMLYIVTPKDAIFPEHLEMLKQ